MSTRKVGIVGGALFVRLTLELREAGIALGDNVNVIVKNGEIIIKKEDKK